MILYLPQYDGGKMILARFNTSQRCRDKILLGIVLPCAPTVEGQFNFIDDSAHHHQEIVVNNWFDEVGMKKTENSIEYVQDAMESRFTTRSIPPKTLKELHIDVIREWDMIA
ncbi:hypothetical protein Trydic_g10794 [Trypoxylus dichotomus]